MTPLHSSVCDERTADLITRRHVLQPAIDHYPCLAGVSFTLPPPMGGTPEAARASILRFHTRMQHRITEYRHARIRSGKPSPPTLLRWLWEGGTYPDPDDAPAERGEWLPPDA